MKPCRIPLQVMQQLTAPQERNIYIHPNPLAREIFWQRIDTLGRLIEKHVETSDRGLDFGGGSGSLVRFWKEWGGPVDLVDLDCGDASRLKEYYRAENLRILQQNIAEHPAVPPYDFIVAADVLEHFPDLDFPIRHLLRLLRPGGTLIVSLPTENRLYELGRKMVGKTKPEDHFHTAKEVIDTLIESNFVLTENLYSPGFLCFSIQLFNIACLKR